MSKFVAALKKVFAPLVNAFGKEPVMVATLAMAGLDAFLKAQEQGLTAEDAVIFAIYVVLGGLARQLVWPSVKIDAATATVKDEVILDPPYLGENPE